MGDVQKKLQGLSDTYQGLQAGKKSHSHRKLALMAGQNSRRPWKLARSLNRNSRRTPPSRRYGGKIWEYGMILNLGCLGI
jgi:hypothetical protein